MYVLLRDELEKLEKRRLKPYAALSIETRGREIPEAPDEYRTCFQRDRDRIIHCKSFRRLKAKTQVFISDDSDHYRTRLTHTLEVAQISRGIARTLGLNEDLAEAIALAHDLGHTPFGHAGEDAMNEMMMQFGLKFEHNEQSQRVVCELERIYPHHNGLNLSKELIEGLMKHFTPWDRGGTGIFFATQIRPSLEAEVVNLADEIAYQNHDTDDGLRSSLIQLKDLQEISIWKLAEKKVLEKYGRGIEMEIFVPRVISAMVAMMIRDTVLTSAEKLQHFKIIDQTSLQVCLQPLIAFSEKMKDMNMQLRELLMKKVYFNSVVRREMEHGAEVIKELFTFYYEHFDELPRHEVAGGRSEQEKVILIKDYIAGMTDAFALQEWQKKVGR